jgi:hypothetical protein
MMQVLCALSEGMVRAKAPGNHSMISERRVGKEVMLWHVEHRVVN